MTLKFTLFRVNGCCKHVGALLWHIEYEVKNGNNVTCTLKPQEWHKPSKKIQKQYGPALMTDITLSKPNVNDCLIPCKRVSFDRSTFDPRAEHHRYSTLTQKDIDDISVLTDYNCGLILLLQERDKMPEPDIEDVANCVEVASSAPLLLPKSVKEIINCFDHEVSLEEFILEIQLSAQEGNNLEVCTRDQRKSKLWNEHRA